MAEPKDHSALYKEAEELGIDPNSYSVEDEAQVAALQERVDNRKAEIAAVEGGQKAPEGESDDKADKVLSKSSTKTK